MEYILHIIILICIYAILSLSLNLLVGYTGILSVAHAVFYGVRAYVAALIALRLDSPFLLNLILAMIGAAIIGAVCSGRWFFRVLDSECLILDIQRQHPVSGIWYPASGICERIYDY
ncbi:MAG: hypothetical protein A2057_05430 [Ignavibacteria bacterium GWA2_35_9]|nr:MAG: hypothetical protein A2057_05430 [Ignavibacteria bacterium GWA2_35_9]OGU47220.1 MAG: hypothetical protein A2000_00785 [Ignavibacteria bacterium GWB2_36_8]OGU50099.1 MAG: hypothetical protein A2080_11760 [Ignavibacteria bacterium GWC2_36_12]